MSNPIKFTMALPLDVHLDDIDWTDANAWGTEAPRSDPRGKDGSQARNGSLGLPANGKPGDQRTQESLWSLA